MERLSTLLFLALLLLARSISAQKQRVASPLESHLKALALGHHGDVAFYAENLKTHQTVSMAADVPVQTASVIKLAILYEALEQVRVGNASLADRITMTATDQVEGSGVLHFFDAPLTLTLRDVLTMMIVMSDNAATNLAIDHLGVGVPGLKCARGEERHWPRRAYETRYEVPA